MTERERLVELIDYILEHPEKTCLQFHSGCSGCKYEELDDCKSDRIADYLIANGVIVPTHKPIGVAPNRDKFISDVYCPYCDALLSGYYGDDPPQIITCYKCGEYLDCTKLITKEEAEQALKGGVQE